MITNEKVNKDKFNRMINRHSVNKEYKYQNGAVVTTFKDTWSMTMVTVPCHPRVILTGKNSKHAFIMAKNFNNPNQSKLEDF